MFCSRVRIWTCSSRNFSRLLHRSDHVRLAVNTKISRAIEFSHILALYDFKSTLTNASCTILVYEYLVYLSYILLLPIFVIFLYLYGAFFTACLYTSCFILMRSQNYANYADFCRCHLRRVTILGANILLLIFHVSILSVFVLYLDVWM